MGNLHKAHETLNACRTKIKEPGDEFRTYSFYRLLLLITIAFAHIAIEYVGNYRDLVKAQVKSLANDPFK